MKYLFALTLAVLLVIQTLTAAEASTIHLMTVPDASYNPSYAEAHHFNVQTNAGGLIPASDPNSFFAFAMTGYFNSSPTTNFGGAGIYIDSTGEYAYLYVQGFTPVCTAPSVPAFNGRGCLIAIPNSTSLHPMNQLIEWDYYPAPYNEWEAFARDNENTYLFIGKFVTTIDWFTGVAFDSALKYGTVNNPQYGMYSVWNDPQGWIGGLGFMPWTRANVVISVDNANDSYVCWDGIYGIMRIGILHGWYAGTATGLTPLLTCTGLLWSS